MRRYFVTGTDTDVGKTRVTAALARALADAGFAPTIVKPVQTGLAAHEVGDAAQAGQLARVPFLELLRFELAADPWSAALAQGREAPGVADIVERMPQGTLVIEGAGGLLVPLNATQSFADLVLALDVPLVLVVALRLGCINHARLTLEVAATRGITVAGIVLSERHGSVSAEYLADVHRSLQGNAAILGNLPFAPADAQSVADGSRIFAPLTQVREST